MKNPNRKHPVIWSRSDFQRQPGVCGDLPKQLLQFREPLQYSLQVGRYAFSLCGQSALAQLRLDFQRIIQAEAHGWITILAFDYQVLECDPLPTGAEEFRRRYDLLVSGPPDPITEEDVLRLPLHPNPVDGLQILAAD